MIRFGTVESIDLPAGLIVVKAGEIETASIPWLTGRAGETRSWSPPSVGEQVILLCPEGDLEGAIALPAVFSNVFGQPGTSRRELVQFGDGAIIAYDPEAHSLEALLPAGGKAVITAPDGVTINGDVQINGKMKVTGRIDAEEDVTGKGVSLAGHVHSGVKTGSGTTGKPV